MARSYADFARRSKKSTSPVVDLVTVDRQTLKKVLRILGQSMDAVIMANHCDVVLYSLDNYLTEGKNINVNKSMILLRHYLEAVPESLKEVADNLEEAHELMKVVLDATN